MDARTRSIATLTVRGRLFRSRGASIFIALALSAPVILIYSALQVHRRASAPSTGIELTNIGEVNSADSRWLGVARGDVLLAIDGVDVESRTHAEHVLLQLRPGPVTLRFGRGGTAHNATAEARPQRTVSQLALWGRYIAGCTLWLIGLIAFLLRPGTRVSWLFMLFCLHIGTYMLCPFLFAWNMIVVAHVYRYTLCMTASLGVHLFAEFPQPVFGASRRRWLAIAYVPTALCWLPYALTFPTIEYRHIWQVASIARLFWVALAGFIILALVAIQYRRARRTRDRATLLRARAIIIAVALGLQLPALWQLARQGLHLIDHAEYIEYFNALPIPLFAAITAYTLVQHNALAVDRFTAAAVGYAVTLVLLAAGFAAVIVGLPSMLGRSTAAGSPELLVAITAACVVGFLPVHRYLRRRVDRWFHRDSDEQRRAAALEHVGEVAGRGDRATALRAAREAALVIEASRAELWLVEPSGEWFRRDAPEDPDAVAAPIARTGPLGRALATAAGGIQDLAPTPLPADAQAELWQNELAMATPVRAHGRLAGFLAVGRRLSGTAFLEHEQSFLSALASQIGLLLDRATDEGHAFGRYRIERRLGVGGMAEVFLAWQLGPGGFERKVALKRPLPDAVEDPSLLAMFLEEARIAAQLSHPNIAQIHEVDTVGGIPFIAMEYVHGQPLRALLRVAAKNRQHVPVPVATAIVSSLLAALAHAHHQRDGHGRPLKLVHRDVTPGNVLISARGDVKLVDFGIARAATQRARTETGVVKGTIPYMSPEQASGGPLDHRTDLYSATAILYELITLQRAYPNGWTKDPLIPPSQRRHDVPIVLDAVVLKGLAPRCADRFDNANAMRDALLAAGDSASEDTVSAWMRSLRGTEQPQPESTAITQPDKPRTSR